MKRKPIIKRIIALPTTVLALLITIPAIAQDAEQSANSNSNKPTMSTEDLLKRTPDGVTVLPDIAYREGNNAWKLDLAMSKEHSDAPRPAIVYIHGGGWKKGDMRRPLAPRTCREVQRRPGSYRCRGQFLRWSFGIDAGRLPGIRGTRRRRPISGTFEHGAIGPLQFHADHAGFPWT